MQNARIFLAHDSADMRRMYCSLLAGYGLSVVVETGTPKGAFMTLANRSFSKYKIDVALVATDLTPESREDFEGRDGAGIAEAIKREFPNVKVVVLYPLKTVSYGDVQVQEINPIKDLAEAITSL